MADTLVVLQAASVPAEKALFGVTTHTAVGTAASGANSATLTARTGQQWYVSDLTVSFGATITAACTLTIKDGSTVIWQAEIPTATNPLPITISFARPLHGTAGAAVVAAITTPGSIASAISLAGFPVVAP